ncbi:MAG: Rrf2 family transcriptional regulator [Deltaproteobacteria bacterium]|nr:Rrf2 family transcriptional regulator [Deltaproteobacteria bacterium]
MKLGTRARYSLRMMMAIAKLSRDGKPAALGEVARDCCLSRGYLDQLAPALKNASLVRAHPGRGGGYMLRRPPEQIRLLEIVEATIGPIAITECAADPGMCEYSDACNCQDLWSLINFEISGILNAFTLSDLVSDDWPERIKELRESLTGVVTEWVQ